MVLYVDSGSTLNINGKKRLVEYFELLSDSNKDMLLFKMPTIIEKTGPQKRFLIILMLQAIKKLQILCNT